MNRRLRRDYPTDKMNYLDDYIQLIEDQLDQPIKLLEIGVYKGGSIQMWRDLFSDDGAEIYGIDINGIPHAVRGLPNVEIFVGNATDTDFLRSVVNKTGRLDIIIDDGSHIGQDAKTSFWFLFNYLKNGGIYIIEDWGTGYWDHWADGNQPGNMVDFVKELIDEMGTEDSTRFGNQRKSWFKEIRFRHALCAVIKGGSPDNETPA